MADRLIHASQGRRIGSFRTDKLINAWLICSLGAAFTGSVFFSIGMAALRGNMSLAELIPVTLATIGLGFIFTSLLILIAAGLVAPPVTWLAARLRLESALFHVGFGGACGYAAGWLLSGDDLTNPFERMTLISGPIFGGTWGLLWWLVYRRHIGKGRVSGVTRIFG